MALILILPSLFMNPGEKLYREIYDFDREINSDVSKYFGEMEKVTSTYAEKFAKENVIGTDLVTDHGDYIFGPNKNNLERYQEAASEYISDANQEINDLIKREWPDSYLSQYEARKQKIADIRNSIDAFEAIEYEDPTKDIQKKNLVIEFRYWVDEIEETNEELMQFFDYFQSGNFDAITFYAYKHKDDKGLYRFWLDGKYPSVNDTFLREEEISQILNK